MVSIDQEIQQRAFSSPAHKVQVNIIFTAAWLNQRTTEALKPFELSIQQFNILRILRGRRGKPSTVKLLTQRMIDKMSNASRLVDRLKDKGFVDRQECSTDRRRVDIVITQRGLDQLARASRAVEEATMRHFEQLSDEQLDDLSYMLDVVRNYDE